MTNTPITEPPPTAGQSPPGPPSHHRRQRWIGWAAASTALVLAISLSLYFTLRGNTAPPSAANPATSPTPTASAPAASAPAVILPTTSPTTSTSSTPANPAPDGRIPADVLNNATLLIPPWPVAGTPSGPITFTNGVFKDPGGNGTKDIHIGRIVYGDVDRDGATETVALISPVYAGGNQQLLAFDRDRAGHIVTLGTVLSTNGPLRIIDPQTYRIESNGVITARVGDYARCCGDQTPQLWQWRSYGWNGHGFRQVAGPTAFPVNPAVTETAVTTGDLVLGPATAGTRHGTLTITARYLYGAAPDHLIITFSMSPDIHPYGTWPPTDTWHGQIAVNLPAPTAETPATYSFAFSQTPTSATSPGMSVTITGIDKKGNQLSDADPSNNMSTVRIRTTG